MSGSISHTKIFKAFLKSKICCKLDVEKYEDLLFHKNMLEAKTPDNPNNINWENLGISRKNVIFRTVLIYLLLS